MKKLISAKNTFLLFLSIFCLGLVKSSAQNGKWAVNGSLGFGYSFIGKLPNNIYNDGGENIQLGILAERTLSKKISIVFHTEADWINYSFDGYIQRSETDNSISLIPAPADVKYTKVHQLSLSQNFLAKFILLTKSYTEDNKTKEGSVFLQTGLRFSVPVSSNFKYRENNSGRKISMGDFTNPVLLQTELSVGIKGELKGVLSILSSSTIGLIYQFTPMYKNVENADNIRPYHIVWRFYF